MSELKKPFLLAVAGGTGSGKSTVATAVSQQFGQDQICVLPHDAYYKQFDHLTKEQRDSLNFDHPESFDNKLFLEHLQNLKNGEIINRPNYDFTIHSRQAQTTLVSPTRIILVEGILILADPQLREQFDLKIFVDTEADLRILRRIERDIRERGRTLNSIISQYLATVKPMHDDFVEPSKKYADLIIPEGGHNQKAINMLIDALQKQL